MKTLLIKNTTPIQENFLGHNAVYHGFAGLPDDAGSMHAVLRLVLQGRGEMRNRASPLHPGLGGAYCHHETL